MPGWHVMGSAVPSSFKLLAAGEAIELFRQCLQSSEPRSFADGPSSVATVVAEPRRSGGQHLLPRLQDGSLRPQGSGVRRVVVMARDIQPSQVLSSPWAFRELHEVSCARTGLRLPEALYTALCPCVSALHGCMRPWSAWKHRSRTSFGSAASPTRGSTTKKSSSPPSTSSCMLGTTMDVGQSEIFVCAGQQ